MRRTRTPGSPACASWPSAWRRGFAGGLTPGPLLGHRVAVRATGLLMVGIGAFLAIEGVERLLS